MIDPLIAFALGFLMGLVFGVLITIRLPRV
jgi:hypothetical protein